MYSNLIELLIKIVFISKQLFSLSFIPLSNNFVPVFFLTFFIWFFSASLILFALISWWVENRIGSLWWKTHREFFFSNVKRQSSQKINSNRWKITTTHFFKLKLRDNWPTDWRNGPKMWHIFFVDQYVFLFVNCTTLCVH